PAGHGNLAVDLDLPVGIGGQRQFGQRQANDQRQRIVARRCGQPHLPAQIAGKERAAAARGQVYDGGGGADAGHGHGDGGAAVDDGVFAEENDLAGGGSDGHGACAAQGAQESRRVGVVARTSASASG